MKKRVTFSLILLILTSCSKNIQSSSPISSSLNFSFYEQNETSIFNLNNELETKKSFILLIYSPNCLYCHLSENIIKECIITNNVDFYTLNTNNTKNISVQNFYIEAIKIYIKQNEYNENRIFFENEYKLYTPTLISIKEGKPNFTLVGYSRNDYKIRIETLISKIKGAVKKLKSF